MQPTARRVNFQSQQPVHKHYEDRTQYTVLNHVEHMTSWSQQFKKNAQDSKGVLLLHHNAHPHTPVWTPKTAWQLHLDVLQQTPCRPDLDILITSLVHWNYISRGHQWGSDQEVKKSVPAGCHSTKNTLSQCMHRLVHNWAKCSEKQDYVEK